MLAASCRKKIVAIVVFVFLVFGGMVMYANEVGTNEFNKNYLR